MNSQDLVKELECSVCHNTLNSPVTLICQHTFCRHCVGRVNKCPLCRTNVVTPPIVNSVMETVVVSTVGIDEYKRRQMEIKEESDDIKKEDDIRRQVFNDVVNAIRPMPNIPHVHQRPSILKIIGINMAGTIINNPLEVLAATILIGWAMYRF